MPLDDGRSGFTFNTIFSLAKPALPRHLGVARVTLELYGIATPVEFVVSLHKAG